MSNDYNPVAFAPGIRQGNTQLEDSMTPYERAVEIDYWERFYAQIDGERAASIIMEQAWEHYVT